MNKKAQEEMIGFVLIVIIIAVLILILLVVTIKKPHQTIESYEIESFLQALSFYTTNCSISYLSNYQDIKDLARECIKGSSCIDGRTSCEALNSTLSYLIDSSWPVGEKWPNKAYVFNISSQEGEVLSFSKGNFSSNNKGSVQDFNDFDFNLEIYY